MNRLRAWIRAHPKRTRAVLLGAFVLLCLFFLACMGLQAREALVASRDRDFELAPVDTYVLEDLSRRGNSYTPIGSYPRLAVMLDQQVACLLLYFSEPVPGPVEVRFALSPGADQPTATYQKTLDTGGVSLEVSIEPMWVNTLSVSFGMREGLSFTLDGVFLRQEPTYEQRLLGLATTALAFGSLLLLCGAAWLLQRGVRLEWVFLAVGLALGLCYLILITPFAPPDELSHYYHTYARSSEVLGCPDEALDVHYDFTGYLGHFNQVGGYTRLIREAFRSAEAAPQIVPVQPASMGIYEAPYLPATLGITLARLLGCNFLGVFYLGRLCNLLLYIGCAFFALRRVPRLKSLFFLSAILPMALHQAISFSTDAFINGLSLLLLAHMLSAIWEPGKLRLSTWLGILIPAVLLAPAKAVYVALALPVVVIPKERFPARRWYWAQLFVILGLCIGMAVFFNLRSIHSLTTGVQSVHIGGAQNYTLNYLLAYPLRTLSIFYHTLAEEGIVWMGQTVGLKLAGLTLPLPSWYPVIWWALLLCAAFPPAFRRDFLPSSIQRLLFFLVVAAVVGLTMFSMFLGWTSDTDLVIQGIQGRYFLPVVIPLCLVFRGRSLTWQRKPIHIFLLLGVFMNCLTLLSVLQYTIG